MRILLWTPVPWAKTAYAKNALNIALRFKEAGHEVAIFAFGGLQWGEVEYKGIKVFPNNAGDYGQTFFPIWFNAYKPDIVIYHYDAWILGGYRPPGGAKIAWYSPVDHDPVPPPLVNMLKTAGGAVISMTKFAQAKFKEAGIESIYIPHAIDTKIYYPSDRKEARKRIELPEDCFLFLSVATNKGPRKNLGNVLRAYKNFLDIVPEAREDSFLFMHCFIYGGGRNRYGYNLPEIWRGLNIAERIKCTEPDFCDAVGFTEEEMADLYRSADWSILTSLGEGFGLPLIESLACGTPCVYSNFSALPEVVGPGGLPVDAVESIPFELSSSFQFIPSTKQITERMTEVYKDWKNGSKLRDELGEKGRQYVLQNYDYSVVMPKWLNLAKAMAGEKRKGPIELLAKSDKVDGEVDIMILTHEHLNFLQRCIETIYTETNIPFHLIVIDDISADRTEEYMKNLWEQEENVTYVRLAEKAKGGSQMMNVGLNYFRNDLIVSMNNDIVVTKGWLEEAVKCIKKDPKIGIVGMKFLYSDNKIQHAGGAFIKGGIPCHIGIGEPKKKHSGIIEAQWVSGPCVLIRHECLGSGWDETYDNFGGHEDIDLCLRVRKNGWKVMYCGKSEVYHLEGATVLSMPGFNQMFRHSRSIFMLRWGESPLVK